LPRLPVVWIETSLLLVSLRNVSRMASISIAMLLLIGAVVPPKP
jgi:hypothetical protein